MIWKIIDPKVAIVNHYLYIISIPKYTRMKKERSLKSMLKKSQRDQRKEQGFFDGRFMPRVESPKKQYSRKKKHSKLIWKYFA